MKTTGKSLQRLLALTIAIVLCVTAGCFSASSEEAPLSQDVSVQIDLMKQGSEELNHWLRIVPSIYYFSYYFNCVSRVGRADNYRATDADFPFLRDMANLVLRYYRRDMLTGRKSYDELAGDGLVQIASAMHPNNEPFKDYDPENIEPGVWQVMPEQRGDHGTAIGLFAPKERTHAFYLQLLSVLCGIEEKAPEAAK